MIYARFGDEVAIVRRAEAENEVVIRYMDDDTEDVSHIAYLRADDGLREINAVLNAIDERDGQ